jgi:hypothetical protein
MGGLRRALALALLTSWLGCVRELSLGSLVPLVLPPRDAGASCTDDGQCQSHTCGVGGNGNCCRAACSVIDSTCGATGCDDAGLCAYPDSGNPCGTNAACSAGALTPSACSGDGRCLRGDESSACPDHLACNATGTACLAACGRTSDCIAGWFCDQGNAVCCTGLEGGGTLRVDGANGHDGAACCGFGGREPCQTVSRAMALIDSAAARNTTIVATVDGGTGDWPAPETYPIVLGWGVELSAPGVVFRIPDSGIGEIFDVKAYSSSDTLVNASVVGSETSPVGIVSTPPPQEGAIRIESVLYIANANILGGIHALPSSYVFLGEDLAAAVTGTVYLGDHFISCDECTIQDGDLSGMSSVVLGPGAGLVATGQFSISLTSNPVIGAPPPAVGFGTCSLKYIGDAISLSGSGALTFKNGLVQCIGGTAFSLSGGTVVIDNTVIQNTDVGISAGEGANVSVTNSVIRYNAIGVEQSTGATVDLSGGGNSVVCSSSAESSVGSPVPGIDVWNAGAGDLNASNVAWDTAGPDYFSCDTGGSDGGFLACSCNLASCSVVPGSDGMDAVTTGDGGILLTGHTQSPDACL